MRRWPGPVLILARLLLIAAAAMAGHWLGAGLCEVRLQSLPMNRFPFLARPYPLPHHVPRDPGGISFRFAMVHDVIHERFPRHGLAYYEWRDRRTRASLGKLPPDDPARFSLMDDLGVGLERMGKSDEAVAVLREKFVRQKAKGASGKDLYTTYANLGTFLIHASYPRLLAGDMAAMAPFEEGIGLIRKSVEVNPEAHFGREVWQSAIAEFLAAAMRDPSLLREFDCLGNRLSLPIDDILSRDLNWITTGYGRPYDPAFAKGETEDQVPAFWLPGADLESPKGWPQVRLIRGHITRIGAEDGWESVPVPSHRSPVAFDEPVLGIIGMWRQGGGANPHFALALGETMLRVGQRYLAWSAYERASQLAGRFSKDPSLQQFLRDHCRTRQADIERSLTVPHHGEPRASRADEVVGDLAPGSETKLHVTFDADLNRGTAFQKAFQDYESARLAEGSATSGEAILEDFERDHESIATRPGAEERFQRVSQAAKQAFIRHRRVPSGFLGACLFASIAIVATSSRRQRPDKMVTEAGRVASPAR